MRKQDIVVLVFAENNRYTSVIGLEEALKEEKALEVDLKSRIWSYQGCKGIPIGSSKEFAADQDKCYKGVIGVYDCLDISQLNIMVFDAVESANEARDASEDW